MKHPGQFEIIDTDDLTKLTSGLIRLSKGGHQEETLVHVKVDNYTRRFKLFMKNVHDDKGKIFAVIGKMEDVDDELSRLESIEARAMFDQLCVDVYNKATTIELIKAELARGTGGVLMILDVDDFKSVNDNLGHMFGDEFLKKFASTIKSVFRATDIVGRYGGDEFIVFLPRATASLAKKKGWQILEKVLEIEVPQLGTVKSSIGAAVVNPSTHSYDEVFKQADTALYQAKNYGKNRVEVYNASSMTEGIFRTRNEELHNGRDENTESTLQQRAEIELSSNPSGAASVMMRVFSVLYSAANVDEGIAQALELVGKTYDISRVYIFEDSNDGKYCFNTFEWCNDGITPFIDDLQNVGYETDLRGVYHNCYNDDGIIYSQDISSLPPEIGAFLEMQGIKSVLLCAIQDGGKHKGIVGFDECRSSRFWTQDQIDSLVFLSKIISVFLLKGRSEEHNDKQIQ